MAQTANQTTASKVSDQDYKALLRALNKTALISMTDSLGIITYANDRFVQVSKYSLDELIGQNHRILKSGQQPDTMFDDLWITISRGGVWRGQIKNRSKDGTYYWVDTSITPILDERHKPKEYISVRFLMTDAKETAAKLEEYNTHLKKLNSLLVGRNSQLVGLKKEIAELDKAAQK